MVASSPPSGSAVRIVKVEDVLFADSDGAPKGPVVALPREWFPVRPESFEVRPLFDPSGAVAAVTLVPVMGKGLYSGVEAVPDGTKDGGF